MKKCYLKEFQVDIGWVILIFSFKFDAFGRYGSKTKNFSLKKHQSVAYFIEKLVILSKYIIFHEDGSNGTALQWRN